jgi:hypothetical protein
MTVSQAICQLLTAVAEGRLSLSLDDRTRDSRAFAPGDLDDEFLELEARGDPHNFATRWGDGRR